MIRQLILRRLAAEEKQLGASLDYMRHILSVSLGAFFKFVKIFPLASYRRALPAAPCHVARLVATRDADCGTCLQIEVNLARKAGVPVEVLRAALDARPELLSEELADVYRFAEAVVKATYDEGPLRERLRSRYGERGLVEVAMAMAACRVFPIAKRALGYAVSCQRVDVEV